METTALTEDEVATLAHWSIWGSDGYPVQKVRGRWHVTGFRGCGACPSAFKTKREATKQWEAYIDVLIERKAGRL
jgi:hypothetical protein